MEILKDWVSDICVTILFMTAIELVLPDNSIKKYAKFVLGLIFIVVVINPIITLVNQDNNLYKDIMVNENYIYKLDDYIENNLEEYSDRIRKSTLESFEDNLERNCINLLKDKFPNNKFTVEISSKYENGDLKIQDVVVRIESTGIKKVDTVEKVILDDTKTTKVNKESTRAREIKKYLASELNVSENIIKVYEN